MLPSDFGLIFSAHMLSYVSWRSRLFSIDCYVADWALSLVYLLSGDSGLQRSNHKYWAHLIWIQRSPLTWLCWLESHQILPRLDPAHTSHFLIKREECLRDLYSTVRKGQREIVFLSICHADEAPGHGAVLFYTRRPWEEDFGETCSGWGPFQRAQHYYLLLLSSFQTSL